MSRTTSSDERTSCRVIGPVWARKIVKIKTTVIVVIDLTIHRRATIITIIFIVMVITTILTAAISQHN